MSKFVMVTLLVVGLAAGAVPASAQAPAVQGGIGDPDTLAASAVVIPFFTSSILSNGQGNTTATVQVASPVGTNDNAHMFFFDKHCARIPISVGIPLTTNDIAFQTVNDVVSAGTDGLVVLAQSDSTGFALIPLANPVHARIYQFNSFDGRSRVIEPIIVNTAEFSSVWHWWSPLRSGGTFYAPQQTTTVQTDLLLFCPTNTVEGLAGAALGKDPGGTADNAYTDQGFPQINPRFPAVNAQTGVIRVRIYNTNEVFKRNLIIDCDCNKPYVAIATSIDRKSVV